MASRTKESPRKIELVSIIDVVFLLLIFFLVTINIMQNSSGSNGSDVVEEIKIPDMESMKSVEADMVIIFYPWGADGSSNIDYYLFTPSANWGLWNQLVSAGTSLTPAILSSPALKIHVPATSLESCLRNRAHIVLKATEKTPWKEVVKIWDMCRRVNPSARISFMIASPAQIFTHLRGLIANPIVLERVG